MGKLPTTQQHGQFLGVDAIAFGFAAMDGFEVERVSQQKAEVALMAEVGQPVPIEGRLTADDQITLFERLQCSEEPLDLLGVKIPMQMLFTEMIDDTDVHRVGMQVDPAVEFVLSVVEVHHVPPWVSGLEPRNFQGQT